LPANSTLTNGTGTFSATLKTAGNQGLTATDTLNASITGTSGAVAVVPAATSRFGIVVPVSANTGVAFSFTVTAQDAFGNTTPTSLGTVKLTSSDPAASFPVSTYTFVSGDNGAHVFTVTLNTAGTRTITATDTSNSAITGTSGPIVVLGLV